MGQQDEEGSLTPSIWMMMANIIGRFTKSHRRATVVFRGLSNGPLSARGLSCVVEVIISHHRSTQSRTHHAPGTCCQHLQRTKRTLDVVLGIIMPLFMPVLPASLLLLLQHWMVAVALDGCGQEHNASSTR